MRDQPLRQQIAAVEIGKFEKPDLIFESGQSFGYATNNRVGQGLRLGLEPWIGREIELFLGEGRYEGKSREMVLVRPIAPTPANRAGEGCGES